jgi:hypothetical protein
VSFVGIVFVPDSLLFVQLDAGCMLVVTRSRACVEDGVDYNEVGAGDGGEGIGKAVLSDESICVSCIPVSRCM